MLCREAQIQSSREEPTLCLCVTMKKESETLLMPREGAQRRSSSPDYIDTDPEMPPLGCSSADEEPVPRLANWRQM